MKTSDKQLAERYLRTIRSAEDRGIEFNLSFALFKSLFRRNYCPYSGIAIAIKDSTEDAATIDRIDNNKGYVRGNVIVCSMVANRTKGSLPVNWILNMAKVIKRGADEDSRRTS